MVSATWILACCALTADGPAPAAALAKVKAASQGAEVVIAVLGETANMSSEAASRASMELPGIQEQMLEAAAASGKAIILAAAYCFNADFPMIHHPSLHCLASPVVCLAVRQTSPVGCGQPCFCRFRA